MNRVFCALRKKVTNPSNLLGFWIWGFRGLVLKLEYNPVAVPCGKCGKSRVVCGIFQARG